MLKEIKFRQPSYYVRQCELEMPQSNGNKKIYHASIPEKHAKIGNWVKIDEENWKVAWVSAIRIPIEEAQERSRDHLKQRKVSDI